MIILYVVLIIIGLFCLFLLTGYIMVTYNQYKIKQFLKKIREKK